MNIQDFKNIFRPFLFALAIVIGIYISVVELYSNNNQNRFIFFTIATSLIFIFELVDHFWNKSKKVQLNLNFGDKINELWEIVNKVIIPAALYFGIVLYAGIHIASMNLPILLIFVFFLLLVLFLNINYFFKNNITLEHKTHFIYDLIKFTLFYLYIDFIVNWASRSASLLNYFLAFAFVVIISMILKLLILWKSEILNKFNIFVVIVSSLISGICYIMFVLLNLVRVTEISWFLLYLFYISIAIIHHKSEGTLTKKVVYEYFFVSILLFVLFVGLR